MITINEVPTRTPMPIVDINRSRDCDKEKDSGKEPARKELEFGEHKPNYGYHEFSLTQQP